MLENYENLWNEVKEDIRTINIAAEYYIVNKDVLKKRQETSTEICQKKKKKQKGNIAEIDTRKLKINWEVNYKNDLLLV